MKKILIISDCLKGGGVEKVLCETALFLSLKGFRVYVAANATSKEGRILFAGSKVSFIPLSIPSGRFPVWSFRWFVDRLFSRACSLFFLIWSRVQVFDYAVAFKEGPSMLTVSYINAIKRIGWIHVDYRFLHWTSKYFPSSEDERQCMSCFSHIVCVSQAVKDGIIFTIGDPGNLTVCYNPINYVEIQNKASQKCSTVRSEECLVFVSVGRLDAHKNYSMLIEACSTLEQKYSFEMWIIGDGKEKEKLLSIIKENSVHSVKLMGAYDNPYPLIKAADCFVCSSKSESYGLAVQEALILGIPVIATHSPGIEESLDDRFGIITENSVNELEKAMETILQNPKILTEYQKRIKEAYQVDQLYESRLKNILQVFDMK